VVEPRRAVSAVLDFPVKPEARPYLEAAGERAGEPEWLRQLRRRNLARFAEQGFPSRRGEAWRYLDLRPLEQAPLLPVARAGAASPALFAELGLAAVVHRLVLVDGRFAPGLSALAHLPSGVTLTPAAARPERLRDALEMPAAGADRSFAALNGAFFSDGYVLEAAPGTVSEEPIEILHLASGAAPGSLHTRSLVVVGAESRVRLLESFAGDGRYWRNDVTMLRLGRGAVLERAVLVEETADAVHFGDTSAELGPAARLADFALLLGGRTVRRETSVRNDGEGAHCGLYGAFLLGGRQEANIVTAVEHVAERAETREVFKGVAAGGAHGAFQGRITVRPGAQKTDAHMLSRNLLLGHRAAIDTKPELEIFADDVKCSHGAAVGDLDEAALFYLLARGIPRETARRMLIEAFIREAIAIVEPPPVREHLMARLARRLDALEE
jgi:Fe-S cluster assembly protein SufD